MFAVVGLSNNIMLQLVQDTIARCNDSHWAVPVTVTTLCRHNVCANVSSVAADYPM